MNFENLSKNRISFEIKNNKIGAINRFSLKLLIKKRRDKSSFVEIINKKKDAINRVSTYLILHIYILRLYCPPTSNKALVICPNEQTFVASINFSKIF